MARKSKARSAFATSGATGGGGAASRKSPTWEAQKENAAPLERGQNVASFGLRQSDTDKQDLK